MRTHSFVFPNQETKEKVPYADDTICVSHCVAAMNRLLKSIEVEGGRYGMKLNKDKCEVTTFGGRPRIKFQDGSLVKIKDEVKYLGCTLNRSCDAAREVSHRICQCMIVLKRLDLFWGHSNCSLRQKLIAYDAVIKSKLIYGMESAQLNPAVKTKTRHVPIERPEKNATDEDNICATTPARTSHKHK